MDKVRDSTDDTMVEKESDNSSLESDSDSDDSDSDDAAADILRLKVQDFKQQLLENEHYYDGYVGLIATLRELGELEEARKVRQKMSEIYPLSPALWLEWVKDEQAVCSNAEERSKIVELFERAIQDYTSVPVWLEYIMFMVGGEDVEKTREVCDGALTAVGTHVAEGLLIWQAAILVEQQVYSSVQAEAAADSTEGNTKEEAKQRQRIQALLRRQARVPLMNTAKETLLEEASQWFQGEPDPQLKSDLEKSVKKLGVKIPYEEAVLKAKESSEKLAAYRIYIQHVQETDNPSAVVSLYERAITDHCLVPDLWEEYISFLMHQFASADYIVLPACRRSQRNCPGSGALCELHITAIEMFIEVTGEEEATKQAKQALQSGLSSVLSGEEMTKMWLAYLVYLRRRIRWDESHETELTALRDCFSDSVAMIDTYFGHEGDLQSEIPRFMAVVEAGSAHNIEAARDIWNNTVFKRNNNYNQADLWLEFITLERGWGTEKHCRKLFRRALERVWDGVELIGAAFLRFERESGTLATMEDFKRRYKDRLILVQKKRKEDAVKEQAEKEEQLAQKLQKKQREKTRKQEKKKQAQKPEEAKPADEDVFKVPYPVPHPTKGLRREPSSSGAAANSGFISSNANASTSGVKADFAPPHGLKGSTTPPPGFKGSTMPPPGFKGSTVSPPGFEGSISPPPGFKGSTVSPPGFEGSIPPPPGFKGGITAPPGFKGVSVLPSGNTSSHSSSSGLKRKPEEEQPHSEKKAKTESSHGKFVKHDSSADKQTVFLSNLDYQVKENEILNIFKSCGEIKELRLTKDYRGRFKGYGYLVFMDEIAAAKALKLDRSPLGGRPVFVSECNPNKTERKFRYSTGLEKDKLFVRGLPHDMTETDVREAFEQHGPINTIRLVTFRNGYSKGICYITYKSEELAESVRKAMDGTLLRDKKISVCISCPESKGSKTAGSSSSQVVSGSSQVNIERPPHENIARGTSQRPKLSLMPRALMRNPTTSQADASSSSSVNGSSDPLNKPKTNEEFRKMLLK